MSRLHLQHVRTNTANKVPTASDLNDGEIAINYNTSSPALFIKDSAGNIVPFISSAATDNLVTSAVSDCITGVTLNGSAVTVSNKTAAIVHHELPVVTATDNGKILQVVNGEWALVLPSVIYTGSGEPSSALGKDGDVFLQV